MKPSLAPFYRALAALAPRVPPSIGYRACESLGVAIGVWLPAYRQIQANLRVLMPGADQAQRNRVARHVLQGVCKNYYDLFRFHALSPDARAATTEVHGWAHVERALARGRGLLIVPPHCGNYTIVFASLVHRVNTRALVVVEQLADPGAHAVINRMRHIPGIDIVPLGPSAGRAVLRALRRNEVVILAGDRAIAENTVTVNFFGRPTPLPTGPAMLALRTGAPLLTACSRRLPDHRARLVFDPPLLIDDAPATDDAVRALTQKIACIMEAYIRRDPSQWLVTDRVWPDS